MAAIYLAWPNYALGQVNPDLEALPAAVKKVDLTGHFFGKVIDAVTGKGIESATIQLLHVNDTVIKNIAASLLATVITNRQGEFNIESIPVLITYQLRIYSLGYAPYRHIISFKSGFISLENGLEEPEADAHFKDLGNIKIFADSSQLDNITLNADRPLYEIKFDRKIYNVEKDLSVTGGTAADVLKNIPSVSVDGNGNPTLRNASPQIFIDGRPTTLSLDQVPADQVASVEIMTNPSARYDADVGGGIINIILKKNRKPGYNGSVRASIDKRGMPGVGGDINMRQGKVNLFASGYGGYRKSLAEATTTRRDSIKDKIAFLTQNNAPQTQGTIVYGRAGMDYFADNRNTFSLTG
ncbi:MAG: TonB-dependent receptor, partial [Ferruginibacter sp.]